MALNSQPEDRGGGRKIYIRRAEKWRSKKRVRERGATKKKIHEAYFRNATKASPRTHTHTHVKTHMYNINVIFFFAFVDNYISGDSK